MTAVEQGTGRLVVVPDDVAAFIYGQSVAYGSWWADDLDDLNHDKAHAEGARIFRTESHPTYGTVIRDVPDETVPRVEFIDLAAKVEGLEREIRHLNDGLRSLSSILRSRPRW